MDECKPLLSGDFVEEVLPCFGVGIGRVIGKRGRGSHSSTFQLNLSRF